ncbi:MAG: hypothetical protein H8E31_08570, partial [Planctomycetes bacterium]|nr:hypothetical protein [Planctomycetota bacterium]
MAESSLPLSSEATLLTVALVSQDDGAPVPGVRIGFWPESGDVSQMDALLDWLEAMGWGKRYGDKGGFAAPSAGSAGDSATDLDTDEMGLVRVSPPPSVPFSVHVQGSETVRTTSVDMSGLAPGERRSLVIEVDHRANLVLFGRVVEDRSGRPVPGSEISVWSDRRHFEEGLAMDRESEREPGFRVPRTLVSTGPDGRFRLAIGPWNEALLWVRKPGYSPVLWSLARGHEAPEDELTLRLTESASVRGLTLEAGAPCAAVTV